MLPRLEINGREVAFSTINFALMIAILNAVVSLTPVFSAPFSFLKILFLKCLHSGCNNISAAYWYVSRGGSFPKISRRSMRKFG